MPERRTGVEEKVCVKGHGHYWDYIGGEMFFGGITVAMLLVAVLLPLEEGVGYIRYIFAGICAVAAAFTVAVVVGHIRFARLPECLLKRTDAFTLQDYVNRCFVKIADITEVRTVFAKSKYGKQYTYGTITLVTEGRKYTIKNAQGIDEAKEKIERWKAEIK